MLTTAKTRRHSRISVDSGRLLNCMLNRELTTATASKESGLSRELLARAIWRDMPVSLRTAARLKAFFGDEVLVIAPQTEE